MFRQLMRYLFPPRRLHRVPRQVTAEYERVEMSAEQQIIIMAGLARDPAAAADTFRQLEFEYGPEVFNYIHLQLRRRRAHTVRERLMMLLRQALGEREPTLRERPRPLEPIVKTNYAHRGDE